MHYRYIALIILLFSTTRPMYISSEELERIHARANHERYEAEQQEEETRLEEKNKAKLFVKSVPSIFPRYF